MASIMKNSNGKCRYMLHLTQEHAEAISAACDLASRLVTGQFEVLRDLFQDNYFTLDETSQRAADETFKKAKQILTGCPPNGNLGIHNRKVPDRARVQFDIHQVIRRKIAWDRKPDGGITVDFDNPLRTGDLPLILIEDEP